MVDVTPIIPADRQVIDSYGPGQFRISGIIHTGPMLVFPDHVEDWPAASLTDVSVETLRPVIDAEPKVEILLLGTGAKMGLLPSRVRQEIRAAGIVVDVMDTGAACRTYNVLLSEARRVAAALLPV